MCPSARRAPVDPARNESPSPILPTLKAASRLGIAIRHRLGYEAITEARRDLAAAQARDALRRTLGNAPKLTDEQADAIASLLRREGADA